MDVMWLISFLGFNLLCVFPTEARISVLPIPKDSDGHGTQYRFQYFVRDELGDYKTQEEAGEGGSARGSYAVEEPDGDLRIVQYTADIGGGFKAHIKVDRAGKSPSKLQEIDIPAEEMRKLIADNRKMVHEDPEPQDSKSYILGPPKKMSDIVMEQAAAIREIISKEIEAERKEEEEEENTRTEHDYAPQRNNTFYRQRYKDVVKKVINGTQSSQTENEKISRLSTQSLTLEIEPTRFPIGKENDKSNSEVREIVSANESNRNNEERNTSNFKVYPENVNNTDDIKTTQRSYIMKYREDTNDRNDRLSPGNEFTNKTIQDSQGLNQDTTLFNLPSSTTISSISTKQKVPIVRETLNPKAVDFSPVFNPDNTEDSEKSNLQSLNSQHHLVRDILPITPNPALAGPLLGGPVRNFNFKNRIVFYKAADRKLNHVMNPNLSQEITNDPQNTSQPNIVRLINLNNQNNEGRTSRRDVDLQNDDQIVLYSPFQQMPQQGYHKTRYVTIPYSVLKPYLKEMEQVAS